MTFKQIYLLKNSLYACFVLSALSMAGCNKSTIIESVSPVAPSVFTIPVLSNLTSTGVQANGMLTAYGTFPVVTASGMVYSAINANPTLSDEQTKMGTGIYLVRDITGLKPNTTYFLRAYIKNDAGIGYGNVITFKTSAIAADTSVTVSTLAGNGIPGKTNGTGINATFMNPRAAAVDAQGNVYVTDSYNHLIRKITPLGVVSTFAGSGTKGFSAGTAATAQFDSPSGITIDPSGNVYVCDDGNDAVYKITSAGTVSILAGNNNGSTANFAHPQGIAVDASGNVYVADQFNHRICKITPAGIVSTFAGTGKHGYTNGNGTSAAFNNPTGMTIDAAGNLYVIDISNNAVRKITPAAVVSTLIGNRLTNDLLNLPSSIAADKNGNLYITDRSGRILTITEHNVLYTLAGKPYKSGFADGTKTTALFSGAWGIAVDANKNIYVADYSNHRIRKLVVTIK